jgi:putative transposase
MMQPLLRRTWARCGVTPTIHVRARSHEKVSGLGALVVSPRRRRLTLALALHPKANIRGPQVLEFLRALHRQFRESIVLLWDRGTPHRHRAVRAWLEAHPRMDVVWLPPYAPELNPVEQVWTYLKYGRLANFVPDEVSEIHHEVRHEARLLGRRQPLLRGLFRHAALPFRV